jgi:hypothetical protein
MGGRMQRIEFCRGEAGHFNAAPGGPGLARLGHSSINCVPFENNMSRLTSKVVFRSAVILILLGVLMALVVLTNPVAISMATATFMIGVVMIAIASFAGL